MSETKETRIYFDDPRLKMTLAGRMFVRVASSLAFFAGGGRRDFSYFRNQPPFWLGALILLFSAIGFSTATTPSG